MSLAKIVSAALVTGVLIGGGVAAKGKYEQYEHESRGNTSKSVEAERKSDYGLKVALYASIGLAATTLLLAGSKLSNELEGVIRR
jgi:hypothetical protein